MQGFREDSMNRDVKLTLVEQAMQSNYTRKNLDRVSIRQFVNRLLLLIQKPRIFLFYKKETSGWRYSFSTHGDVMYKDLFNEQIIKKIHIDRNNKKYYSIPKSSIINRKNQLDRKWPLEPLQIGETGFGMILVTIETSTVKEKRTLIFSSPIKDESSNNISDSEYLLFKDLWNSFLFCDFSKSFGVEKRIKKRLEQLDLDSINIKTTVKPMPALSLKLDDSYDKSFIDHQLNRLANILDASYKGICETPLICHKGKIPPNLFFFVRYYDGTTTVDRFKNGVPGYTNDPYPYSLRIIIPKTQRVHLLETLRNIALHAERFPDKDNSLPESVR